MRTALFYMFLNLFDVWFSGKELDSYVGFCISLLGYILKKIRPHRDL